MSRYSADSCIYCAEHIDRMRVSYREHLACHLNPVPYKYNARRYGR